MKKLLICLSILMIGSQIRPSQMPISEITCTAFAVANAAVFLPEDAALFPAVLMSSLAAYKASKGEFSDARVCCLTGLGISLWTYLLKD
ncbi:MAG TPA: hypothetical protein VLG50_04025 [Candidatus Saccharimonadales bacterium]|nr:hypothetical protein [Candidatus Saccharimonadales bacterium]